MAATHGAAPPFEEFPAEIRELLAGAETIPLPAASTGVHRQAAYWPDGRLLHVQTADATSTVAVERLLAEQERLNWFADRLPVPEVLAWVPSGPAVLVTRPPAGSAATEMVHHVEVEALIRSFAEGLRRLHELSIDGCPFDQGTDQLLAEAAARVQAGLIEPDALSSAYRRFAPTRLYELLVESRPTGPEDLVVAHGAYGLHALHLDHGVVTGYVDVGRAGVADRYVDLAVAARELAHTISPEALGPFFVEYGIDYPDLRKIDFYVLLDELR